MTDEYCFDRLDGDLCLLAPGHLGVHQSQQREWPNVAAPSDPDHDEQTLKRLVRVLNVLVFLVPLLVGIFIGYAVLR